MASAKRCPNERKRRVFPGETLLFRATLGRIEDLAWQDPGAPTASQLSDVRAPLFTRFVKTTDHGMALCELLNYRSTIAVTISIRRSEHTHRIQTNCSDFYRTARTGWIKYLQMR